MHIRTASDIENCESCKYGLINAATPSNSAKRLLPEEPRRDDYRTQFAHDRDRIIHSLAFQRLVHKTQVFCGADPSRYTTRLLHTLKVAQVAQTISRALRINEDLTVAIALGHDIGHAPFGHLGEEILRQRLIDDNGFEHNEEGVLLALYFEQGLNLTVQTLEGILKHTRFSCEPYSAANVRRYDPFQTIKLKRHRHSPLVLHNVFKYMGPAGSDQRITFQELPTYEAQVVDIADEIAYVVHDLEDCLARGTVTEEELPPEWQEEFADDPKDAISSLVTGVIDENFDKLIHADPVTPRTELSHTARLSQLMEVMKNWYEGIFEVKLADQKKWANQVLADVFELFVREPTLLREYVHPWYYRSIVRKPYRGKSLVGHCMATLTDHEIISIYDAHLKR